MSDVQISQQIRNACPDCGKRVAFLWKLREVVGRRCEVNKAGSPVVSDFDLITSTIEEKLEALAEFESHEQYEAKEGKPVK
jgi:hypothetical protein